MFKPMTSEKFFINELEKFVDKTQSFKRTIGEAGTEYGQKYLFALLYPQVFTNKIHKV